jgi:charged multivesicular body protein 3
LPLVFIVLPCIRSRKSHHTATAKVAGTLSHSTEVMKAVGKLVKLPQLNETMRNMAMEMQKAGIIQEMMDDTFAMMDDPDIELEADAEVDAVLWELTAGQMGHAKALPAAQQAEQDVEEAQADDLSDIQARLAALGS